MPNMETPKNIDGLVNWKAETEATLANIELQISESAHDAAIVLVDLAESTALKHKHAVEHWLSYIYRFLQLVRDFVAKSDGTLVKRMGDGALVSFGTTEAAENFLDSLSRSPEAGAFPHRAAAEFGKVYY
jgi:class 3 adenylate cyclase